MTAKLGDYVEKYLQLRDKKKQMVEAHKQSLVPIDEALARLEGMFFQQMEQLGLDQLKTSGGTAYTSRTSQVTVADKTALMDFVQSHDAWHLIDVRAAKVAVDEFVQQHGVTPPGVNHQSIINVNVRKS